MNENQRILENRLNNSIQHKAADLIPCAPLIECYSARFDGISTHDFLFDYKKAFKAFHHIKECFPIWDIRRSLYFLHYAPYQNIIGLLKTKLPGIDLEDDNELQFIEYQAMSRNDYEIILDSGYDAYLCKAYEMLYNASYDQIIKAKEAMTDMHIKEIADAESIGQIFLYGDHLYFPSSYFSNLRSLEQFVRDVYQIPEILKEVNRIATDHLIKEALDTVNKTGIKRVMIGAPRVNGDIFSNKIFENLFWPDLERCALQLISHDITPIFHLDGNWDNNLIYFKTLPRHKSIIELDGKTDIFKAKKLLDNHTCILGDVTAQLFTLGTPDKVKHYCNRLLSEFGKSGGFIIGSGCTVPYMAKHENVAAFFNAVAEYQNI